MDNLNKKVSKEQKIERLYEKAQSFATSYEWNGWESHALSTKYSSKGERILRRVSRICGKDITWTMPIPFGE